VRSLIEARDEAMLGGEAFLQRLAAIGAADVSGYLRLIEADERTLARLKTCGAGEAASIAAG
jgi:hypothetical protein